MFKIMDRIGRLISQGKASVIVNGVKIVVDVVDSVTVSNNGITVNGKKVNSFEGVVGPINVQVEGSIGELKVQAGDVSVSGDVGKLETQAGDVDIEGSVEGDVKSQVGDIEVAGSVAGSVKTSCGDVSIGGR